MPILSEEEKTLITEIFVDSVIPKLRTLNARNGILNCDFAGQEFGSWNIRFESAGPDFRIVDFEYDEESCGISLEL